MQFKAHLFFTVFIVFAASCNNPYRQEIRVKNNLGIDRDNETVSVVVSNLKSKTSTENLVVRDSETDSILTSQWIDMDGDSVPEELIFQLSIQANQEKRIVIEPGNAAALFSERRTYARFVPERIDDFAWENDLVAFRTYGPEAQRLVDEGKPGGTLSSGMDCWLKRVHYPIIDKWYEKNTQGGSYHRDDGEGLDNYHVGASRGCGGIGVWQNDSLYVSKNFISYRIIANGPIRSIFELTYAPWPANGISIHEKKKISIDLGNQLSRFEVTLDAEAAFPNCTIGLTLHDKKGNTFSKPEQGWFSYWESLDDSELGVGIVTDPAYVLSFEDYRTTKKDLSQVYIITKPQSNKVVYYAGFGWKKAGVFNDQNEWNAYLDRFSKRMRSPLEVRIIN